MTAVCRSSNVVYPPFLAEMQKGIMACRDAGHEVHIFETFRTPERQDALYAQGRSTNGRIVTHARGWESWHQFGVAADIAIKKRGIWSWDFSPQLISHYFAPYDLTWGGDADGPHYQWKKLPLIKKAKEIVDKNGVLAFWQTLES
jgi:hypothetical protein